MGVFLGFGVLGFRGLGVLGFRASLDPKPDLGSYIGSGCPVSWVSIVAGASLNRVEPCLPRASVRVESSQIP